MRRIRLSYSQLLRRQRCPQAWHMRYRRGLVPIRKKRPPPPWGDAYHAAAAVCWKLRADMERSGHWGDGRLLPDRCGMVEAVEKLANMGLPGLDVDAVAEECARAAVEVCQSIGPEWRVAWLDGAPVVEREIVVQVGEISPWWNDYQGEDVAVDLVVVIDLCLEHVETGRRRVVDHKSTGSWPEETGDVLGAGQDLVGLDLRDDLQVRLYTAALNRIMGAPRCRRCGGGWTDDPSAGGECAECGGTGLAKVEGGHLVRFAGIAEEPRRLDRGSLSRAKSLRSSPEAWRRAIRRYSLREEDYQAEIAQSSLVRWHAYAPAPFTNASVGAAVRQVIDEAEDILHRGDDANDHPRRHVPGRWQPNRQGRWSGLYPATGAEAFAYACCAACDYRDLCVAEEQKQPADEVDLILQGQFEYRPIVDRSCVEKDDASEENASDNEEEPVD